MPELLEQARKYTSAVQIKKEASKVEKQKTYNRLAKKLAEEAAEFADDRLPIAIDEIASGIKDAAKKGEDSFERKWEVELEDDESLPLEELMRYDALRSLASEHFAELGFSTYSQDTRNGSAGYEILGVNPNADRWISAEFTDHVLSLVVSWGED